MSTHQHSGTLISDLNATVDNVVAMSKMARADMLCTDCGEKFSEHCGWNEQCPHPRRHELNQPFFIEGQFFTLRPFRCDGDVEGLIPGSPRKCGVICEPGKKLCADHYEE